jgi:tetratricopeptide (TPR) repeat protein
MRDRHLGHVLGLVVEAEPNLTGRDQQRWFDRLAAEQDNVRGALTWACDTGDGERALMLAGSFWRFWWTRGPVDEAGAWYERAFDAGGEVSDAARARGMFGMAHVSELRGDVARTRREFEEAAGLLRQVGETRWLILALSHLGGSYGGSEPKDPERAEGMQAEALRLAKETGDLRGEAIVKSNLASQALTDGQLDRAATLLEEVLEADRARNDVYGLIATHFSLAKIALRRRDIVGAATDAHEGLRLSVSIGEVVLTATALPTVGGILLGLGRADIAVRLCASATRQLESSGLALDPPDADGMRETLEGARRALGDGFDAVWATGAELDIESAVGLALTALGDMS